MSDGKYSRIIHEYLISIFFSKECLKISFSWLLYIFYLKNLPGKQSHSEIHSYYLYIFNIRIRYSWILWKIFVNSQIDIFLNRNNIHEIKLWQIGIGIYLWPKYQRIDSWQVYLQTICELFANRELLAEHCHKLPPAILAHKRPPWSKSTQLFVFLWNINISKYYSLFCVLQIKNIFLRGFCSKKI